MLSFIKRDCVNNKTSKCLPAGVEHLWFPCHHHDSASPQPPLLWQCPGEKPCPDLSHSEQLRPEPFG